MSNVFHSSTPRPLRTSLNGVYHEDEPVKEKPRVVRTRLAEYDGGLIQLDRFLRGGAVRLVRTGKKQMVEFV